MSYDYIKCFRNVCSAQQDYVHLLDAVITIIYSRLFLLFLFILDDSFKAAFLPVFSVTELTVIY